MIFDIFNQTMESQNDKNGQMANFCCCGLERYDVLGLVEFLVVSDISKVFRGNFSYLGCSYSVCHVSYFLR